MFDPVTDLVLFYFFIGAAGGYLFSYANSMEGQWKIQYSLLKKNAKIWINFIPGRWFEWSIIVPKTEQTRKGNQTYLLGLFDAEAPIYHRKGSAAHYIFSRQGEAPAFDPEKCEYGYYEQTTESKKYLADAVELDKKNKAIYENYQKAVQENRLEDANKIGLEIERNNAELEYLATKSAASRVWWKNPALTTGETTTHLDNAENLVTSQILKGFLGKLETVLTQAKWLLIIGAVGGGIAGAVALFQFATKYIHF